MARWIREWEPEDEAFWARTGKAVARRNLIWSIVAENIGFSVWLMWSVVAANLPKAGFHYTTDELFLLVALPGLFGAILRFPYTFAVPKFGGRNWTIVSALLLLIPTFGLAALVTRPETPFWAMAAVAATAGLGGGNFASSMANISFFFPDREKGFALGLNAAGGNIGVATVQLLAPIVITLGAATCAYGKTPPCLHLEYVGLMWVAPIALAALGAFAFMDNLESARSNFKDQIAVMRRKHTWFVSFLYIGTFGSFVGYSAAFPLLLKTQFPMTAISVAFLGPLVGSIARPLGGKIADRLGGARVTVFTFVAIAAATVLVLASLRAGNLPAFLAAFLLLFVTTGVGNGSTFKMVPVIFRAEHLADVDAHDTTARARALDAARRDTAAVLGISSAIGALGGYFIPRMFGASIKSTGSPATALAMFLGFYAACIGLTWWQYLRTATAPTEAPRVAQQNT